MSETVIKCESVYKIFGENAKKMLEELLTAMLMQKPFKKKDV